MNMPISEIDKKGYIILIGIGAFIIMMVIIAYNIVKPPYSCDDNNLNAHTMIIIDTTDPLTEGQQKRVRALVKVIKDEIKTHEKFSIFILEAELNGLSDPLFSACQPPKGSEANPFYQNRRIYEKRYRDSYEKLFNQILPRITLGGQGTQSPIMEALIEAGQRSDFSQKIAKRRLVLISDMLQNTNILTFLNNNTLVQDNRRQTNTRGDNIPLPNLLRVQVEMHIIQRPNIRGFQGDSLTKFWVRYFQDAGAQVSKIEKRF